MQNYRNWSFLKTEDLHGIKVTRMEDNLGEFFISNTSWFVPWWLREDGQNFPPPGENLPEEDSVQEPIYFDAIVCRSPCCPLCSSLLNTKAVLNVWEDTECRKEQQIRVNANNDTCSDSYSVFDAHLREGFRGNSSYIDNTNTHPYYLTDEDITISLPSTNAENESELGACCLKPFKGYSTTTQSLHISSKHSAWEARPRQEKEQGNSRCSPGYSFIKSPSNSVLAKIYNWSFDISAFIRDSDAEDRSSELSFRRKIDMFSYGSFDKKNISTSGPRSLASDSGSNVCTISSDNSKSLVIRSCENANEIEDVSASSNGQQTITSSNTTAAADDTADSRAGTFQNVSTIDDYIQLKIFVDSVINFNHFIERRSYHEQRLEELLIDAAGKSVVEKVNLDKKGLSNNLRFTQIRKRLSMNSIDISEEARKSRVAYNREVQIYNEERVRITPIASEKIKNILHRILESNFEPPTVDTTKKMHPCYETANDIQSTEIFKKILNELQ